MKIINALVREASRRRWTYRSRLIEKICHWILLRTRPEYRELVEEGSRYGLAGGAYLVKRLRAKK